MLHGTLLSVFDPEILISYGGLLIMFLAVYAQTGLFFCFFLPSGVFLFTGGLFIATGQLNHNFFTVYSCMALASVLGCITGYFFGRKTGPLLRRKKDSRFFRQKYLRAAEKFYQKHGQLALIGGLFFPITRTFAPIVAGLVRMKFTRFFVFIFIGSVAWVPMYLLGGYLIGIIPAFKEYVGYIMPIVIVAVTAPSVIRIIKELKKAGDTEE
ncbi:MAG: DedA family protein [Panacibacter sp.]